jgi:hypothetical protein
MKERFAAIGTLAVDGVDEALDERRLCRVLRSRRVR